MVAIQPDSIAIFAENGGGRKNYYRWLTNSSTGEYVSIKIEKQTIDWFLLVNDELVGSLPIAGDELWNEIRFSTSRCEYWFNEVRVVELVETQNR